MQQRRVVAQMVAGNVTPVLDLLKAIGEYSSITYVEDGVTVTHARMKYAD